MATKKKTKKITKLAKASDLTTAEKKTIARMTASKKTMRQIAEKLGRAPSTIWRHQQG